MTAFTTSFASKADRIMVRNAHDFSDRLGISFDDQPMRAMQYSGLKVVESKNMPPDKAILLDREGKILEIYDL